MKSSKKFIMSCNDKEKTSIPEAEKYKYEYIVFETEGSNLKACLSHELLDENKTYCNDMT